MQTAIARDAEGCKATTIMNLSVEIIAVNFYENPKNKSENLSFYTFENKCSLKNKVNCYLIQHAK